MFLFHVSPVEHSHNIRLHGLLVSQARGSRPAIWCVTASRVLWAVRHVAKRHHCARVVVYAVWVPRGWLRPGFRRGWWAVVRDVPPWRVGASTLIDVRHIRAWGFSALPRWDGELYSGRRLLRLRGER